MRAQYHSLAGLLAFTGKDITPTQSDEERAVYQVVGAGIVLELAQTVKALTRIVAALGGVKT